MRLAPILAAAALLASGAGSIYAAFSDSYTTFSCTAGGRVPSDCTLGESSLIEEDGPEILIPLSVPTVMAAVGLVVVLKGWPQFMLWTLTVLMIALCTLAIHTIAVYYLPAAMLLLVATVYPRSTAIQPS